MSLADNHDNKQINIDYWVVTSAMKQSEGSAKQATRSTGAR